jgi:hypothetical protein
MKNIFYILLRKLLLNVAILLKAAVAVTKGIPKAAGCLTNGFLDNFYRFFNTVCSGFHKPFHDSTTGFFNRFRQIGLELAQISNFR